MGSPLHPLVWLTRLKGWLESARWHHRIRTLRNRGMHIGRDVTFPTDLFVDEEFCALMSIGDGTAFGPECMLLAHDVGPGAHLGAVRVGRIVVKPSCHIGARTIILPNVELGPRTVVAANSVVSRSLPPDTVCVGRPARPFCTLAQYLDTHRERIETGTTFEYSAYAIQFLTPERQAALVSAVLAGDAYIVGGRSAELQRTGGSQRTRLETYVPPPPSPVRSRHAHRTC